jgi:carbonic anhydrase/acetyltransferase-like protein (isoleucine patch superfamily)
LIGIGTIILDNAEIEPNCIITEGMIVPWFSRVLGVPARIKRRVRDQEVQELRERTARYVPYKNTYLGL